MQFFGIESDVTNYLMTEMKKQANQGLGFLYIPFAEIELNAAKFTDNDADYLRYLGYRVSYKDDDLLIRW